MDTQTIAEKEASPGEITLTNVETNQEETFKADENGIIKLPVGRWTTDGDFSYSGRISIQGASLNKPQE